MDEKRQIEKLQEEINVLRNRNEDLEDFIENGSIPLHWVDENGIIVWANQAELDSLGYTKEEYIGHPIKEFHADEPVINDILKRLIGKETLHNYPARLKRKDGSIRDVLINSNVRWKDDKFIHTRCFTRDISEIKELERKKDEFMGAASHELKTPLTSLKAYIQLLDKTISSGDIPTAALYLNKTNNYVERLNRLIDELLDVSRIQGGKLQLEFAETDIDELINETIDGVQHIVSHKIIKQGGVSRLLEIDKQREKTPLHISKSLSANSSNNIEQVEEEDISSKPKKSKPAKAKSTSSPKAASEMRFLTELNLRPKGKESLKDFAAKHQIKTSEELSLLIVYYLKEVLNEPVTLAHVFTCLKELGKKIPTHLKQVLINNKNAKNWIDLSDWNDIKFTVAGMNYIEHDFTKV